MGPSKAIFFIDDKNPKNANFLPIFLGGPMGLLLFCNTMYVRLPHAFRVKVQMVGVDLTRDRNVQLANAFKLLRHLIHTILEPLPNLLIP